MPCTESWLDVQNQVCLREKKHVILESSCADQIDNRRDRQSQKCKSCKTCASGIRFLLVKRAGNVVRKVHFVESKDGFGNFVPSDGDFLGREKLGDLVFRPI